MRLAVVVKGKARGGPAELARHLRRTDTNERMSVLEIRGVAATDLDGAIHEMTAVAIGARTTKPLYHASINTRADERMTAAQKLHAIDRLERELGLTDQPRAIVVHEKKGREHMHIVWLRVDAETMRTIPDSHNYRKHETVARELEREFGHARVQGAHVERDDIQRPDRTPSLADLRQTERSGLTPAEIKERVTEFWRATDSGRAFAAALDQAGFVLARGDRRDFVLIDSAGETHSLARRVDGVKAAGVRERMADINPETLPSAQEARARQLERRQGEAAQRQSEAAQHQARPPHRPEPARGTQAPDLPPAIARIQEIKRHADEVWNRFDHGGGSGEAPALNEQGDTAGKAEEQRQAAAAKAEQERQQQAQAEQLAALEKAGREYAQAEAKRLAEAGAAYNAEIERRAKEAQDRQIAQAKEMHEQAAARAAELHQQQAQADAYLAEQQRTAQQARTEQQYAAHDIRDPNARYAQALGKHYDVVDPYRSLARAAMAEYAAFMSDREKLTQQIARAADPAERQALEVRKKIEGLEYLAITGERIAKQSEIITGCMNSEEAVKERARVAERQKEATELRRQLSQTRQQEQARESEPRPHRPRGQSRANENEKLTPEQQREKKRQIYRDMSKPREPGRYKGLDRPENER